MILVLLVRFQCLHFSSELLDNLLVPWCSRSFMFYTYVLQHSGHGDLLEPIPAVMGCRQAAHIKSNPDRPSIICTHSHSKGQFKFVFFSLSEAIRSQINVTQTQEHLTFTRKGVPGLGFKPTISLLDESENRCTTAAPTESGSSYSQC